MRRRFLKIYQIFSLLGPISILQAGFLPNLVEIGLMILEKKIV